VKNIPIDSGALSENRPAFADEPLERRVWKIAVPAIGENLLQTALMMVDTLMIARFGPVVLSAAAVAGVVIWRAQMTFGSIDKGTMALAARCAGSGDKDKLGGAVAQSILLAIIIGSAMAIAAAWLAPQLMRWMRVEEAVVWAGVPYLVILGAASVPRMFFAVAAASLRATGDTRSPMWIALGMNVINIAFNFPLIYGLPAVPWLGFSGWGGLGLTGSGISTALSLCFAAVVCGYFLLRGRGMVHVRRRHFVPHLPTLRSLVKVSFPSFIEELLISIGFLAFFQFIAVLGTKVLAAHAISTRIEALSFMAGVGFAVAAAALVGQALGRKDVDQARQAFRVSTKYCVGMMSAIAVGLILCSHLLVAPFAGNDPFVRDTAAMLLVIAAIEQPLMGIGMTLGGGLRGAGDTMTPMISTIICNVIIRVGASYFFAFTMGYGIVGIYLGTVVDWMVRAVFLFWFYRWERWTRIKL